MVTDDNPFLVAVLNTPDQVKNFLIDNGVEGKSTAPISFFSVDEKEKFIRKSSN